MNRRVEILGGGVRDRQLQDAISRIVRQVSNELVLSYGKPTAIQFGPCQARIGDLVLLDPSDGPQVVTLPRFGLPDVGRGVTIANIGQSANSITVMVSPGSVNGVQSLQVSKPYFIRELIAVDPRNQSWLITTQTDGSTSGPYDPWSTVYEVDFTALTTQAFTGNGSVTIDGLIWTVSSFANARTFGLLNGSGLQIYPNGLASDYENPGSFTAPRVSIPLTSILSEFGYPSKSIRLSVQAERTLVNQNFERTFFGLEKTGGGTTSDEMRLLSLDGNNPSLWLHRLYGLINNTNPTTVGALQDLPTSHDVGVLTMHPCSAWVQSGSYASGWPTALSQGNSWSWATYQHYSAGLSVVIGASNSVGLGNLTYDVKRMRVDVWENG